MFTKQKGLTLFEWGMVQYPERWEFPYWLATFLNHYQQPHNALPIIEKAVNDFPWAEKLYFVMSSIYSSLGKTEESAKAKARGNEIQEEKKVLYESAKVW